MTFTRPPEPTQPPEHGAQAMSGRRMWALSLLLGVVVFAAAELAAPRTSVSALALPVGVLLVMVILLRLVAKSVARTARTNAATLATLQERADAATALNAAVSELNTTLRTATQPEKSSQA